jgi:hypothetical protein
MKAFDPACTHPPVLLCALRRTASTSDPSIFEVTLRCQACGARLVGYLANIDYAPCRTFLCDSPVASPDNSNCDKHQPPASPAFPGPVKEVSTAVQKIFKKELEKT